MEYDINDIQAISKTTKQSLYKLMKSNSELAALMEEHRITKGKKTYYDEVIYEWFKQFYAAAQKGPVTTNGVAVGHFENIASESPNTEAPPLIDFNEVLASKDALIEELRQHVKRLESEIEALRAAHNKELESLQDDLKNKEAERVHFISENTKLSSLLAAEKAEKQKLLLMLPPPKVAIRDRIKGLFTKAKQIAKGGKVND